MEGAGRGGAGRGGAEPGADPAHPQTQGRSGSSGPSPDSRRQVLFSTLSLVIARAMKMHFCIPVSQQRPDALGGRYVVRLGPGVGWVGRGSVTLGTSYPSPHPRLG